MAYCYFDGKIIDESKATISIHNIGVQRGFGVFDLFRVRNGKPCFIEDHLDRFDHSQQFLGLDRLISKEEIRQAVDDLQAKNKFSSCAFKLMLLGSGSELELKLKPLFYITNIDLSHHSVPETANAILYEYLREFPDIKSTNYLMSNHLHQQKIRSNAIDVIYHKNGRISEASRSNVFMVKDGIIITPKDEILAGVTRKNVLKLASNIAPLEVRDISPKELLSADEIFITSTLKEVLPIVRIGSERVGGGQNGPITQKIKERFDKFLM